MQSLHTFAREIRTEKLNIKVKVMFVSLICVPLLCCPVLASNVYTPRKISEEAWSGDDTGIRIGTKFAPVHFTSMMTAMMECAIQCDQTSACGMFKLEEREEGGIVCNMAELRAFSFKESVSGPGLEVYIRKDLLKQAGNLLLTLPRAFINLSVVNGGWSDWDEWGSCRNFRVNYSNIFGPREGYRPPRYRQAYTREDSKATVKFSSLHLSV